MSKTIIYNLSYLEYINLISRVEGKFNKIKSILLENNIILYHPSVASFLEKNQSLLLEQLFKKSCKKFSTAPNFYNCLIIVNYHIGSLLQINTIIDTQAIQSVSISLEDILIIKSFEDL